MAQRQICVREKEMVYIPVTPPTPWKRELNLPPAKWFEGEWLPARMQREAAEQEIEEENTTLHKWLKFVAYLITGTLFIGGSLGLYLLALVTIGTP